MLRFRLKLILSLPLPLPLTPASGLLACTRTVWHFHPPVPSYLSRPIACNHCPAGKRIIGVEIPYKAAEPLQRHLAHLQDEMATQAEADGNAWMHDRMDARCPSDAEVKTPPCKPTAGRHVQARWTPCNPTPYRLIAWHPIPFLSTSQRAPTAPFCHWQPGPCSQ